MVRSLACLTGPNTKADLKTEGPRAATEVYVHMRGTLGSYQRAPYIMWQPEKQENLKLGGNPSAKLERWVGSSDLTWESSKASWHGVCSAEPVLGQNWQRLKYKLQGSSSESHSVFQELLFLFRCVNGEVWISTSRNWCTIAVETTAVQSLKSDPSCKNLNINKSFTAVWHRMVSLCSAGFCLRFLYLLGQNLGKLLIQGNWLKQVLWLNETRCRQRPN